MANKNSIRRLGVTHARKICAVAFLFALSVGVLPSAWGQAGVAVRGTVTDPSGAAIPSATVHLVNTTNNQQENAQADAQGNFVFPLVAPGSYRLEAEATGFENYQQQIQIKTGVPTTINVKMTIGQVQQQVKVQSQSVEDCLAAEARVFPGIGRGLRAIRRGPTGNYYVLTAPGPAVIVYNNKGVKIGQVPAQPSPVGSISYGEGLDVDSTGRIYVADRGANAVKIYSPDGAIAGKIPVLAPVSVKALSGGEVAVASQFSPHLVDVYDLRGRQMESFGGSDPDAYTVEQSRPDQKALIDRGWFYGDASENLFFDINGAPDPTIRKYDRYGYAAFDIKISQNDYSENSLTKLGLGFRPDLRIPGLGRFADQAMTGLETTLEGSTNDGGVDPNSNTNQTGLLGMMGGAMGGRPMMHMGMGMGMGMHDMGGFPGGGPGDDMHDHFPGRGGFRRPDMIGPGGAIEFNKHPKAPDEKVAINSFAVETGTEDLWVAIAGDLIHYDKAGNRLATYCIYTVDQEPISPTAIVIEDDDILLGTDPFGVFEYVRPDRVNLPPSTPATTPASAAASSSASAATALTTGTTQEHPAAAAPTSAPTHP